MLRKRLLPHLEAIRTRQVTNRDLAKKLQVSEGYLSHVLAGMGVKRDPVTTRKQAKDLVHARRAFRLQAAQTLGVKKAASVAQCSERTIYRILKKNA